MSLTTSGSATLIGDEVDPGIVIAGEFQGRSLGGSITESFTVLDGLEEAEVDLFDFTTEVRVGVASVDVEEASAVLTVQLFFPVDALTVQYDLLDLEWTGGPGSITGVTRSVPTAFSPATAGEDSDAIFGTFDAGALTPNTFQFTYDIAASHTVVPEPSTAAIFGMGIAGLVMATLAGSRSRKRH